MDEYHYFVQVDGPMPDFRTIITFLWSDFHNVDSDGNSHNPASRDWSELYLQNREKENEVIEIFSEEEEPKILRVVSSDRLLALGVAYFLVHWSSGEILDAETKSPVNQQPVMDELELSFDLLTRVERAEKSIWNRSTLEEPYPNLEK
jgi:hypothetical protein